MSEQGEFVRALLDPGRACPNGLMAWHGSDPQVRFAVYRNNVMSSLVGVLADAFPVVAELVGREFFRAMGGCYVRANLPGQACLATYGADLGEFIDAFEPAASLPYLGDVARLEAQRNAACHAADASAIDPARLSREIGGADAGRVRMRLHPSLRVLRGRHAAYSLWAAHQGALDLGAIDPYAPESALSFRAGLEVATIRVSDADAVFMTCLIGGHSLRDAALAAGRQDDAFDLATILAIAIRHELLCGIDTSQVES